ncbi:hypothetical protein [Winogradskyella sp. MIT101101]|uniref:hypothetical protein n=1 Tax=Winogradskyella sp. MIT101101 TaxID=3098297 RepID=UPI0039998DE6
MKNFFLRLNNFFRNLLLDDVDKDYGISLPYRLKPRTFRQLKDVIKQKRAQEQNEQSRGI